MSAFSRAALLSLTLSVAMAGCESKESAPPRAATPQKVPAKKVAAKKVDPAASQSPCRTIQREFRALLKMGKGTCQKDADCVCYPAIADCGGATDRLSWGRLHTLVRMFRLARCKPPAGCTAAPCKPQCVSGRCRASAQASR